MDIGVRGIKDLVDVGEETHCREVQDHDEEKGEGQEGEVWVCFELEDGGVQEGREAGGRGGHGLMGSGDLVWQVE